MGAMSLLDNVEIAIVAPCPQPHLPHEGWMSRIRAIDRQFRGHKRVYLNFSEHHSFEPGPVTWHAPERAEIVLHPSSKACADAVSEVVSAVRVIYVHTHHLAEYVLPWLSSGKVCVDIHGVTPEEEEMLGRAHLRGRYEAVEQRVLAEAKYCIAVSDSMIGHYAEKYPALRPEWITIPIIEAYPDNLNGARANLSDDHKPIALYSGGTQAWQNVDAMLDLAKVRGADVAFRFLSHDHQLIGRRATELGVDPLPEIGYLGKAELPDAYRAADFGFVLRDDSPVNRVSCPTKLAEYLQFGLVPVVRSPLLGDFHELGFAYVTEEEFAAGFLPDAASREWMIERNLEVIWTLADKFRTGVGIFRNSIGLASNSEASGDTIVHGTSAGVFQPIPS